MTDVTIERRPDPKAELGYVCPGCEQWSPVGLWKESEVGCEDCGSHSAMRCPLCEADHDEIYTDFEDADGFLEREAATRGPGPAEQILDLERQVASLKDHAGTLEAFLKAADDRTRTAKAEAEVSKREATALRTAWLRAVGGRLLWRPDLIVALSETTTDMRLRLDELDEADAGCRLSAMEAEYGPFIPAEAEEAA
ncbi:protein of unknown function [Methylorubrum extorquens]|uniref:Uncharacterized protein n=1 Tax=Methylorubrum extorquens TaxID=408 RepID=A0A2N9AN98_METEX|nr:hypothetical protein ASF36_19070 [Methylobacterium sp. Leaf90]SOR28818.1 protein of unknown function [Methylorubrum extorquens]